MGIFAFNSELHIRQMWSIHVIGDPDICPNPYLQLELMNVLFKMNIIDASNWKHVTEAVLAAFATLNIKYLTTDIVKVHISNALESVFYTGAKIRIELSYPRLNFSSIGHIFEKVSFQIILSDEYDRNLAHKLFAGSAMQAPRFSWAHHLTS